MTSETRVVVVHRFQSYQPSRISMRAIMPGTEADVSGYQFIQNRRSSASRGDLWSHSSPLRQLGLGTNATQKPHRRTPRKAARSHCTSPLYLSTSEYTEYPKASFNAHGTTVPVIAWEGSAWSLCLDPLLEMPLQTVRIVPEKKVLASEARY